MGVSTHCIVSSQGSSTGDDAWIITGGVALPQSTARFRSNAQETDMRV